MTVISEKFWSFVLPVKMINAIALYFALMENALFWSHHMCEMLKKECFHFDIWAYAKLFYHLELYNRPFISEAYHAFKEQEKSA